MLDATGALWSYATDEWLSYRSPTADETRSRWPVAREWEAVRHARIAEDRAGIERVYAGKVAGSLRKLMPALNGYVVAFAALTGNESPDAACSALARHLKGYERERGEAFASRVAARRRQDAIR